MGPVCVPFRDRCRDWLEATAEPEACHVFTIVRAPTVESTKVGSFAIAGSVPSSLTTIMWADGGTVVTTMAEIETTLCRVLPQKPYLVHLMKEKGHLVGDIYTPTAAADPAADARTICDAPARGARLGASADDQLSTGLSDSAGSLTSRKYRDLLFAARTGDERASMDLVKTLDHDIRLQGDEAFARCTVLIKKP